MSLKEVDPDRSFTSHQVAGLLKVNSTSVNKWADSKKIGMYRTHGGHRRFRAADVILFIEKFGFPMPVVKGAA